MDIISRLLGCCHGQAADAVSAYTQVKMADAHKLLKIPKSECPGDIKLAGKKHNIDPMWKVLNKEVDLGRTNVFPGSRILGMHSKKMRNKQRYCGQLQNHVRIENFCGWIREITIPSKSSYLCMVL